MCFLIILQTTSFWSCPYKFIFWWALSSLLVDGHPLTESNLSSALMQTERESHLVSLFLLEQKFYWTRTPHYDIFFSFFFLEGIWNILFKDFYVGWTSLDLILILFFFFSYSFLKKQPTFVNLLFHIEVQLVNSLLQFQVDCKGTQPYIYMCPFSPRLPSHPGWHKHWAEFHLLYSKSLLVIYFIYLKHIFLIIYLGFTEQHVGF